MKKQTFLMLLLVLMGLTSLAQEKPGWIIREQNVLIIDDVTTSGSTLNEILRTLRILNEDNQITIFS